MTLTLPYPPSTNTAYAVVRGRKIKTARARQYANEVGWRVADFIRTGEQPPHDYSRDRLGVHIDVYPPDARARDLANVEKLVVDAIAAQAGFDDSQIDVLTLRRATIDRTNPRVVVKVETL
jgi:crossover junction endodeoxyribonuclease RusA